MLQVDNKSSTPVELVEMKLHQRLHLMGDSFLGTTNKHIDVVRVATRWVLGQPWEPPWCQWHGKLLQLSRASCFQQPVGVASTARVLMLMLSKACGWCCHGVCRQQAVNAAQGAPGLVSQYVGRLELDRAIEATCLGKVGSTNDTIMQPSPAQDPACRCDSMLGLLP